MNKIILLLIFSIVSFYIQAQEKNTYWDNGNLKSITNYDDDGKKSGVWESYYENGDMRSYGSYENGEKSGSWREYYYNGEIKKRASYNNGLLVEMQTYHSNGRLMITGSYNEDEKKHGNWEQHYDNWQQKLIGEFSHGEKHGEWRFYNKNGNIYKIENYMGGIKFSRWEADLADNIEKVTSEVVDVNDAVEAVVESGDEVNNYNGDRLNGEWRFYNEKGKCIEIGNYQNDEKHGKWTYYYDSGQIKKIQMWEEGKLMEVVSSLDNKGNAIDKGTLKNGNGIVNEYNADGTLESIEYINGKAIDWDNYSLLNSLAWNVYENENDKKKLTKAIKWVKRSIELDKNYYNTDTHAALLYKMGKYKEALVIAEEAIKIAKKEGDDFSATTTLIEEIYIKSRQH